MTKIQQKTLPEIALLQKYKKQGDHTDCYTTTVSFSVNFEQYVEAFYTTRLFKLERLILKLLVSKPSSDQDAALLAKGQSEQFAAWDVERREADQLLLCDFQKRTRSWLMIENEEGQTRLYFGSAVVSNRSDANDERKTQLMLSWLGWFHHRYSIALLSAAKRRLIKFYANEG